MSEFLKMKEQYATLEKLREEMYQLSEEYGKNHFLVKNKSRELDKVVIKIMNQKNDLK